METIALFFIQSIIGGITGNRADSITTSAYNQIIKRLKKTGIPRNHDVERAIRKSYLLATIMICRITLKEERKSLKWHGYFSSSGSIKWLNKAVENFTDEVRQVDKPNYEVSVQSEIADPSIFLDNNKESIKVDAFRIALETELKQELETKFGEIPAHVLSFLNSRDKKDEDHQNWYELLCAFFAEELKENNRLRTIFDAQILSDLRKDGLTIPMEMVEQSLSQIGEKTLTAIDEVRVGITESSKSIDRIENQLREIYTLLNEKTLHTSRRESIAEKYAGYDLNQQQANRVNQLTKEPLIGREKELAKIDHFIESNDAGIVLLTAPAGYGKSAILANWLKQKELSGLYIMSYFFASDQQSSTQAYAHLVRQTLGFLDIKGETIPDRADLLRDMLLGLIVQENPRQDQPLILVLDGLDESDIPIQSLFRNELPANVFVIASLRTNEYNEVPESYTSWKKDSYNLALLPLNLGDLKSWIRQLHLKINETEFEDIARLYFEKTAGYPLYLKFLIDEIKNYSYQSNTELQARILNAPIGFENYVKEQFNSLAKQGEIQQRKELQALFSLLTIADGPLADTDIEAILGLTAWDLNGLPWAIERWLNVTQSSHTMAFSFAHPLLGRTFAQILGRNAKDSEQKLLDYCSRWNSHKSNFVLRYYINQLLRGGHYQEAIQLVVGDKAWLLAKRSKFKSDSYILDDIGLLLQYIQEKKVYPFLQDVVQLFSVREVVLKRAARYRPLDVRIMTAKGEVEEAMALARIQTTLMKKVELWVQILLELNPTDTKAEEIEQLIIDSFQNSEDLGRQVVEMAFVLSLKEANIGFVKRFCDHCHILDHDSIAAEHRIDLFGLIYPYLDPSRQEEINLRTTSILAQSSGLLLTKKEALARTAHTVVSQLLKDIIRKNDYDSIVDINKLVSNLPPDATIKFTEVFDWSLAYLERIYENKAPIRPDTMKHLCQKIATDFVVKGVKEPAIQVLDLLARHQNDKDENFETVFKLLSELAKHGFIKDALEHLSQLGNTVWSLLAKIKLAGVLLVKEKTGDWENWVSTALENITTDMIPSNQRDWAIHQAFTLVKEIYPQDVPIPIVSILNILTQNLSGDNTRCACAQLLLQMNILEPAKELLNKIENLDQLTYSEIGHVVLYLLRKQLPELAEQYYQIYWDKRERYDLYERRGFTMLCTLVRSLAELEQTHLSNQLLDYAFTLAQRPADANYLKRSEFERLAALLLERGKIKESQILQAEAPFYLIEKLDFAPTEVMLEILQESTTDFLSADVEMSDLLFHVYTRATNESSKSRIELRAIFEKINDKLQDRLKENPHKYLILLSKEGISIEPLLQHFLYEFIFSNDQYKCSKALIRFCSGLLSNGYEAFAQQVRRENEFLGQYFEWREMPEGNLSSSQSRLYLREKSKQSPDSARSEIGQQELISRFNGFAQGEQDSFITQVLPVLTQRSTQLQQNETILVLLTAATKIIGWEDGFTQHIYEMLRDAPVERIAKSKLQESSETVDPDESPSPELRLVYIFLRGMQHYIDGNFALAHDDFATIIEAQTAMASFAYFMHGLIHLLQQNFDEAVADFSTLANHHNLSGYAEGMTLRALILSGKYVQAKHRINVFRETDLESYWGWKSIIDFLLKDWSSAKESTILWLENMQWRENVHNESYPLGMAYFHQARISQHLGDTSTFDKALQRLETILIQEKFQPRRFHLLCLLQILGQEKELNIEAFKQTMLDKACLARIDFEGLRPYLNLIMDTKVMDQYESSCVELQHSLWNSLSANIKLNYGAEITGILKPFLYLYNQQTVILLQGNNMNKQSVYSYVKISLRNFRRLRDVMIRGGDFRPNDYGEVIMAGRGVPEFETSLILNLQYKMVDIGVSSSHPESLWEIAKKL